MHYSDFVRLLLCCQQLSSSPGFHLVSGSRPTCRGIFCIRAPR